MVTTQYHSVRLVQVALSYNHKPAIIIAAGLWFKIIINAPPPSTPCITRWSVMLHPLSKQLIQAMLSNTLFLTVYYINSLVPYSWKGKYYFPLC